MAQLTTSGMVLRSTPLKARSPRKSLNPQVLSPRKRKPTGKDSKKGEQDAPKGELNLHDIYKRRFVEEKVLEIKLCAFDDNPRNYNHKGEDAMARIADFGFSPDANMMWYQTPGQG